MNETTPVDFATIFLFVIAIEAIFLYILVLGSEDISELFQFSRTKYYSVLTAFCFFIF